MLSFYINGLMCYVMGASRSLGGMTVQEMCACGKAWFSFIDMFFISLHRSRVVIRTVVTRVRPDYLRVMSLITPMHGVIQSTK